MCRPPEGLRVTIMVMLEEVDDGFPEEVDIVQAVKGLQGGISGVPSDMRSEYLKG